MNVIPLRAPTIAAAVGEWHAGRAAASYPSAAESSGPALAMAVSLHAAVVALLILWAPTLLPDAAPIVVSLEFVAPVEALPPEPEPMAAVEPPPPEPAPTIPPPEPPPRQADLPKPKPKPAPPSPAPPRPVETAVAPPTPSVAPAPAVPTPPAPRAGTPDPSYAAILLRWLERFRDYPRHARLRGIEGTVTLSLTLARSGSVIAAKIHATSGHAILDDAALAMARNADPFPPFPRIFALNRAEFLVPIVFALQ